jgi:hypothetical protein
MHLLLEKGLLFLGLEIFKPISRNWWRYSGFRFPENRPPTDHRVVGNALYWFSGPEQHPHNYASHNEWTSRLSILGVLASYPPAHNWTGSHARIPGCLRIGETKHRACDSSLTEDSHVTIYS